MLLLLGINSPAYCTLESLVDKLGKIQSEESWSPVRVLLINKSEPLRSVEDLSSHAHKAVQAILSHLTAEVEFLGPQEFYSINSFADCEILDLNDKSVCSDNYLIHHCLIRGGQLLNDGLPKDFKYERFESISFDYGIYILPQASPSSYPEVILNSAAVSGFPWFYWYRSLSQPILLSTPVSLITYKILLTDGPSQILTSPVKGHLDLVEWKGNELTLNGWAFDQEKELLAKDFIVSQGTQIHKLSVKRIDRPDVAGQFSEERQVKMKHCGFQIVLESIQVEKNQPLDLFAVFPNGLSQFIARIKINEAGVAEIGLPKPVLTKAKIDDKTVSLGEKSFLIQNHPDRYVGAATVRRGRTTASTGWAFDKFLLATPMAVLAMTNENEGMVIPCSCSRPDLVATLGTRAEAAGFFNEDPEGESIKSVYALFENAAAVKLPITFE